jgi:hypothetical protein
VARMPMLNKTLQNLVLWSFVLSLGLGSVVPAFATPFVGDEPTVDPATQKAIVKKKELEAAQRDPLDWLIGTLSTLSSAYAANQFAKNREKWKELCEKIRDEKKQLRLEGKSLVQIARYSRHQLNHEMLEGLELVDKLMNAQENLENATAERLQSLAFLQGRLGMEFSREPEVFEEWRRSGDGRAARDLEPRAFQHYDFLLEEERNRQRDMSVLVNELISRDQDINRGIYEARVRLRNSVAPDPKSPPIPTPAERRYRVEPSSGNTQEFRLYNRMTPTGINATDLVNSVRVNQEECQLAAKTLSDEVGRGKARFKKQIEDIRTHALESRPSKFLWNFKFAGVAGAVSLGGLGWGAYKVFFTDKHTPEVPVVSAAAMTLDRDDVRSIEPFVEKLEKHLALSRDEIVKSIESGLTPEELEGITASGLTLNQRSEVLMATTHQGIADLRRSIYQGIQGAGTEKFSGNNRYDEMVKLLDMRDFDKLSIPDQNSKLTAVHNFLEQVYNRTLDGSLSGIAKAPENTTSRIRKAVIEKMIADTIEDLKSVRLLKKGERAAQNEPEAKGAIAPKEGVADNRQPRGAVTALVAAGLPFTDAVLFTPLSTEPKDRAHDDREEGSLGNLADRQETLPNRP